MDGDSPSQLQRDLESCSSTRLCFENKFFLFDRTSCATDETYFRQSYSRFKEENKENGPRFLIYCPERSVLNGLRGCVGFVVQNKICVSQIENCVGQNENCVGQNKKFVDESGNCVYFWLLGNQNIENYHIIEYSSLCQILF